MLSNKTLYYDNSKAGDRNMPVQSINTVILS